MARGDGGAAEVDLWAATEELPPETLRRRLVVALGRLDRLGREREADRRRIARLTGGLVVVRHAAGERRGHGEIAAGALAPGGDAVS